MRPSSETKLYKKRRYKFSWASKGVGWVAVLPAVPPVLGFEDVSFGGSEGPSGSSQKAWPLRCTIPRHKHSGYSYAGHEHGLHMLAKVGRLPAVH